MPAYYADSVGNFRETPSEALHHTLTLSYEADRYKDLITTQITSWRNEIQTLKDTFSHTELARFHLEAWGLAIEFVVPRKLARIDAVVLIGSAIVVLEFKGDHADSGAADQAEDYCLDLLYFHEPSHGKVIYPVVVTTAASEAEPRRAHTYDELQPTTFVGTDQLAAWLALVAKKHDGETQISVMLWNAGNYRPVPTIIEAAIGMFAEMEVEDIAKAGCDPINLTATVQCIRQIIRSSVAGKKTICFVTGVPGAGKTLAGLRLVHDRELREATNSDAIFLTGNLPLVKVLQAALARDSSRRRRERLRLTRRDPKTTINTILGYKKEYTRNRDAPHEKIVVFDEAQRAWDSDRTAEYLTDDSGAWIGYSEPALLLSILDRQPWAALVALVGGRPRDKQGRGRSCRVGSCAN